MVDVVWRACPLVCAHRIRDAFLRGTPASGEGQDGSDALATPLCRAAQSHPMPRAAGWAVEILLPNITRLQVSPSSRWPMTSVFCEIGCMLKRWPIGCWSCCLTLTVIAGQDGCTCPNRVWNGLKHHTFGYFDHMGSHPSGDACTLLLPYS